MRRNPVRAAVRRGELVVGTMVVEFGTPGIGRLAAAAGSDFVLLDTEHNAWELETIRSVVSAARGFDTVPLVRVPATEYHLIARTLDVGALGVMVPMVESAAQATAFVRACRYPPAGRRGFGIFYRDEWQGSLGETIAAVNEEILTIAQIESAAGLDVVEEIAAVEGLDVLLVGPSDLSISLGIPGESSHPDFLAALDRVVAACNAHGPAAGTLATTVDGARAMIDRGYRFIMYGLDILLYQAALQEGLAAVREGRP